MNQKIIKFSGGFTLIELMVTVAVIAIMSTLAAPSLSAILASMRVRTAAYSLISDLTLARNEAVKRNVNVAITPTTNDWAAGWKVTAGSGATQVALSQHSSTGRGVQFVSAPTGITFASDGRTTSMALTKFTVTDGAARQICISLDPSGMPKSTNKVCAP